MMKRFLALALCFVMTLCWNIQVFAAVDQLPKDQGNSQRLLMVAILVVVLGGVYLFFKMKKER